MSTNIKVKFVEDLKILNYEIYFLKRNVSIYET